MDGQLRSEEGVGELLYLEFIALSLLYMTIYGSENGLFLSQENQSDYNDGKDNCVFSLAACRREISTSWLLLSCAVKP